MIINLDSGNFSLLNVLTVQGQSRVTANILTNEEKYGHAITKNNS